MFYKPIPKQGETYKYSNKKCENPRSGQLCKVIIGPNRRAVVHNCLVEFPDGFRMVTSKWNLFEISKESSIPLRAVEEFMKSGFFIECSDGHNVNFVYSAISNK